MKFNWLAKFFIRRSLYILAGVSVLCVTCVILPFKIRRLPSFSDPQSGFETRGTSISNRAITLANLADSVKESGIFIENPKEYLNRFNYTELHRGIKKRKHKKKYEEKIYATIKINADNAVNERDSKWSDLKNMLDVPVIERKEDEFLFHHYFCGPPDGAYAHVVLESSEDGADLFTLDKLQALCRIQNKLSQPEIYKDLCIRTTENEPNECCKPWSIVNYIALMRNKPFCQAITEEDVTWVKSVLQTCSPYYHNLNLTGDCAKENYCKAPSACIDQDAAYNIFHYLAAESFLPVNNSDNSKLQKTIIFLPLAGSTAILPYYHELENKELVYGGVSIVAMNFGIKNALFDECLIHDTWLMSLGGSSVFLCIWSYTGSLFLTIVPILIVLFSLGISYFVYTIILKMNFFSFMNFLAVVIAVGIGADNIFIFYKVWNTTKQNKDVPLEKIMASTLEKSLGSILITCLTTSVAFFASFITPITAIRCFSLFATITVIANSSLTVFCFPACIVVYERFKFLQCEVCKKYVTALVHRCSSMRRSLPSFVFLPKLKGLEKLWNERENLLTALIIKFRIFFFAVLMIIAFISSYIVFYYPKMQLPNSLYFQLFKNTHPFEKYELMYKNEFWFSKMQRMDSAMNNLPLYFVWGVEPQDNGNYLEPQSYGSLVVDNTFDMSHPDSQEWLLSFCKDVKKQPFYKPTMDPLQTSCFIEWFKIWMNKPCYDSIEMRDRTPCCGNETFPFSSWVFDFCIIEATAELYDTPPAYFRPGIRGLKFSKDRNPKVKSLVVEFESTYIFSMSYDYMRDFSEEIEKWFNEQIKTAPPTIQGGWFISDLEFYDLQKVLSYSTVMSICFSMILSFTVLLLSTRNIIISLYAILSIVSSIVVTLGILVLLHWNLNVLESVAISTAIGLTVDFSLHYAVSYNFAPASLLGNRITAAEHALSKMFSPVSMAALTTALAGAFMIPSTVLAYIEIGTFLVVVMCVSWVYSTFFLGALLALAGPQNNFGQYSLNWFKRGPESQNQSSRNMNATPLRTRSRISNRQATTLESYELEVLTEEPCPSMGLRRSSSDNEQSLDKTVVLEQSPLTTNVISVITINDK